MLCDVCGEGIVNPLYLDCLLHRACSRCFEANAKSISKTAKTGNSDKSQSQTQRGRAGQCPWCRCTTDEVDWEVLDHGGRNAEHCSPRDTVNAFTLLDDDLSGCNDEAERQLALATSGGVLVNRVPGFNLDHFGMPTKAPFFPYTGRRRHKQTRLTSLSTGEAPLQRFTNIGQGHDLKGSSEEVRNKGHPRQPKELQGTEHYSVDMQRKDHRLYDDFEKLSFLKGSTNESKRPQTQSSFTRGEAPLQALEFSSSSDDDLDFSSGPASRLYRGNITNQLVSSPTEINRPTSQDALPVHKYNPLTLCRKSPATDLQRAGKRVPRRAAVSSELIGRAWEPMSSRSTSDLAEGLGRCSTVELTQESSDNLTDSDSSVEVGHSVGSRKHAAQEDEDTECLDEQNEEIERNMSPSKYNRRGYTYQWVLNEADNRKGGTSSSGSSDISDENVRPHPKQTNIDILGDFCEVARNTIAHEADKNAFDCIGLPEPDNFWGT